MAFDNSIPSSLILESNKLCLYFSTKSLSSFVYGGCLGFEVKSVEIKLVILFSILLDCRPLWPGFLPLLAGVSASVAVLLNLLSLYPAFVADLNFICSTSNSKYLSLYNLQHALELNQ